MDEVIRLSREAWVTWEPTWGTRAVAWFSTSLFRARGRLRLPGSGAAIATDRALP